MYRRNFAILLFAAAGFSATPALAQTQEPEQACDPYAADAANDPDCAGRVCEYATTAGSSATCDHADTCDTATTCEYADNCGNTETCQLADSCTTADHATTCDTAATADSCGTADTADVALSVGECVSGVFSVGGGESPSCGDLRYDGRLGLNTDPTADLDVAGTAALRGSTTGIGLQVDATGNVGIGTSTPNVALDVVGTIHAHEVVVTPSTQTMALLPVTDCRGDAGTNPTFLNNGRVTFDTLHCAVNLHPEAVITNVACAGDGDATMTVTERAVGSADGSSWSATGFLLPQLAVDTSGAAALGTGGSVGITLTSTSTYPATLNGCLVTYEAPTWN